MDNGSGHILVVDDHRTNRLKMSLAVKSLGHTVALAKKGRQALDLLRAEPLSIYMPMDRRQALNRGESLPSRAQGAALFADISGFTPLTEALVRELGPQRDAEELPRHLKLRKP